MSLEQAIKISGFKNPDLAKSKLANLTTKAPLKLKIALQVIANQ